MITRSKVYRVPVRTNELKLNCSVISNPLATIQWQFMPNNYLQYEIERNFNNNNYDYNENYMKNEWKSINLIASYSLKYNENIEYQQYENNNKNFNNSSFIKLPLSKYQIHEKHTNTHQINSILIIKVILILKEYLI